MKRLLLCAGAMLLAGGAFAQDARATFTAGTASAGRGQKAVGVLSVPAGSDAATEMASESRPHHPRSN